jgi:hypothetical protein
MDLTYQPIFCLECRECDASPVVGIQRPDGVLEATGLCGRCFFADRAMIEHSLWNDTPESTE